jgi:aspartyl protease family protein
LDNNNIGSNDGQLGGIFLIIGWLIALSLVGLLLHQVLYGTKAPTINDTYSGTSITLYRDYDSHFRIKGSINGIPVTFLIDTGSTSIAVSEAIAQKAGLQKTAQISADTANGAATGYMTKIKDLAISPIELHNLSAIIIPNMGANEALLGMSVLSKFNIQQTEETLIISVPAKAQ